MCTYHAIHCVFVSKVFYFGSLLFFLTICTCINIFSTQGQRCGHTTCQVHTTCQEIHHIFGSLCNFSATYAKNPYPSGMLVRHSDWHWQSNRTLCAEERAAAAMLINVDLPAYDVCMHGVTESDYLNSLLLLIIQRHLKWWPFVLRYVGITKIRTKATDRRTPFKICREMETPPTLPAVTLLWNCCCQLGVVTDVA